jgi:hypothetical protein
MPGCVGLSHERPWRLAGLDHPRGRAVKLRAGVIAALVVVVISACLGCGELIEASDSCSDGRWRGFEHEARCTERLKASTAGGRHARAVR